MKRHVIDRNRPVPSGSRVKNFVSIARMSGEAHPASKSLWRKAAARPAPGTRVAQYARIDRGMTS